MNATRRLWERRMLAAVTALQPYFYTFMRGFIRGLSYPVIAVVFVWTLIWEYWFVSLVIIAAILAGGYIETAVSEKREEVARVAAEAARIATPADLKDAVTQNSKEDNLCMAQGLPQYLAQLKRPLTMSDIGTLQLGCMTANQQSREQTMQRQFLETLKPNTPEVNPASRR